MSGAWPKNYGQQRRAAVHQRNADRRLAKESYRNSLDPVPGVFWQQGTYTRTYRPRTFFDDYVYAIRYREPDNYSHTYSPAPNYRSNYRNGGGAANGYYDQGYTVPYYYNSDYDRPDAGDIFRNVIFAVLSGGLSDYGQNAYYGSGYPASGNGYSPRYASYRSGPYPEDYSDATDPSYYDPYFYEDPTYAEVLPIQYFLSDKPGTGLFRQMFTHLLAIGYEQGYHEGVAARAVAETERAFYDPYAYDNISYDPYSVSLGDNRRCLSEGYELGYQDALNEVDGYDQFATGDVDLVSVLIGTVSQLI